MTALPQVGHRHIAAEHVIDGHRTLPPRRRPAIHQDHRGTPLLQPGQPLIGVADRGDQDTLNPVFFQQLEVANLIAAIMAAKEVGAFLAWVEDGEFDDLRPGGGRPLLALSGKWCPAETVTQ